MTRNEVKKLYVVQETNGHGTIVSLGKFERECVYVPHFYDVWMNGFADSEGEAKAAFRVLPEDRREFPELKGRRWVHLCESEQGFVFEL